MTDTRPDITPKQRETLAALADELVPAAGGMPSASEAEVHTVWVDRVLAVRPDLVSTLLAVLDAAADKDAKTEIRRLSNEAPERFTATGLIVMGAYYLSPRVRQALGYPGQKPNPLYPDEADYYLRDGLLDPVLERGPIYRATPGLKQ